jgi:hypothetical protein
MRMIFKEEVREAAAAWPRKNMLIVALVAVLLSALEVPAGAGARGPIPSAPPLDGPVLYGKRVLWATPITTGFGGFVLRQAPPSGPASTVARFRDTGGGHGLFPQLAASPSRVVLAATLADPDTAWSLESIYTAPVGGAFETLARDCNLYDDPQLPRAVDVSGELVVYWRRCGEQPGGAIVRDYSGSPPAEEVIARARPFGLRVADRYVAWLEDCCGSPSIASGIAVYDRVTRSIAYEIPRAAVPGELHSLDLQSDGTVAFSYASADGVGGKVGWASIAEPRVHTLLLPRGFSYEVRIAGGRIGYEGGRQSGAGYVSLATIGVSDLGGHTRVLGNLGEGSLYTDDFDFDGRRLAWWSYGCTRALIRTADVSAAARLSPPRKGCALRFTRAPTRTGNELALHVNCFGFALSSCSARRVVITTRRAHDREVVGRGRTAAHVKLTSVGRRLLRHRTRLRVYIHATLRDSAGRREARVGGAVLRG